MNPYTRPQPTDLDRANVEKSLKRVNMVAAQFATVVQIKNGGLVEKIKAYRHQRDLTPLYADTDFQAKWDEIQAAVINNQSQHALRLILLENMRLTMEVIEHQRALGEPLMKVFKLGSGHANN